MVQNNPNNQNWVFRYDYLKCINSKAIDIFIQNGLNISIIVNIIDMCSISTYKPSLLSTWSTHFQHGGDHLANQTCIARLPNVMW